ncbi:minor tail protein [Mycobacterium phage Serenity]|uniref:minor tail protein n=1 Tax=Mycobacterium phage Serenity TaxID=1701853 RepID=UPI0006CE32C2|nr:minor tail protein [Mycobacterium phage Serenity]ALF00897.1 minor tail protein [Mycobacterium phage Serenity]
MTPFNPDSWMDVIALAILAAFSFAGVVAPIMLTSHRKHGKELGVIKEQVANSHSTNLRDDIDEINRIIREGFAETRRDISGIREDIRVERLERIEGDRVRVVYTNGG